MSLSGANQSPVQEKQYESHPSGQNNYSTVSFADMTAVNLQKPQGAGDGPFRKEQHHGRVPHPVQPQGVPSPHPQLGHLRDVPSPLYTPRAPSPVQPKPSPMSYERGVPSPRPTPMQQHGHAHSPQQQQHVPSAHQQQKHRHAPSPLTQHAPPPLTKQQPTEPSWHQPQPHAPPAHQQHPHGTPASRPQQHHGLPAAHHNPPQQHVHREPSPQHQPSPPQPPQQQQHLPSHQPQPSPPQLSQQQQQHHSSHQQQPSPQLPSPLRIPSLPQPPTFLQQLCEPNDPPPQPYPSHHAEPTAHPLAGLPGFLEHQHIQQQSAPQPAAPVQAPADSTTKPRKPRARKKKASVENTETTTSHIMNLDSNQPLQQVSTINFDNFRQEPSSVSSSIPPPPPVTGYTDFECFSGMEPPQDFMTNQNMGAEPGEVVTVLGKADEYQDNTDLFNQSMINTKAIIEPDMDLLDEFGHLSDNPVGDKDSPVKNQAPVPVPATPPKPAPKQPNQSAFQNSFLSFLQGQKPETLSSVTNSSVTKKPVLPKYIPEPPRPKPPPPPARDNSPDSDDISSKSRVKRSIDSDLDSECTVVIPKSPQKTSAFDAAQSKAKKLISPKVPPLKISLQKVKVSPKKSKKSKKEKTEKPPEGLIMRERVSRAAKEKAEQKKREKEEKSKYSKT